MKLALLGLLLAGFGVMLWPWRTVLFPREPPPEQTLLVAVDMATGAARGLERMQTEKLCRIVAEAPAWPALYGIKTGERLDCRAPK